MLAHSLGDFRESLHYQALASKAEPKYLDRAYFHREMAGNLVSLRRFVEAADEYEVALTISKDPQAILSLAADAAMLAGRYRRAEELLASLPDDAEEDAVAMIDAAILALLRRIVNLDEQVRTPHGLLDLSQIRGQALIELLRDTDALDPSVWLMMFATGGFTGGAEFPVALIAARTAETATAWVLALLFGLAVNAPESLLRRVAECALGRGTPQELRQQANDIADQFSPAALQKMTAILEGVEADRYDRASHADGGLMIRIHSVDGDQTHEVVSI